MQARSRTFRLIWLAMAASLVLPLLLFAYSSLTSFRDLHAFARERLIRSLDIQQEESLKTFELIDLTMSNASSLIEGMSVETIRENETRLHLQLEKLSDSVGVVQSIWVYGKDGRTLVSSLVYPAPTRSYLDRDFVQAHLKSDVGVFYGQIYIATTNAQPFFTVSQRIEKDGEFIGVLEISVLPSNIFKFFSTLVYTQGLQNALLREDGLFLARYPMVSAGTPARLGEETGFRRNGRDGRIERTLRIGSHRSRALS